jgi:putative transcriptional regulator
MTWLLQSKKLELSNVKKLKQAELQNSNCLILKKYVKKTGLSQNEFAARLHISPRTLQNWEQGRRYPTGPAATLIRILDAHPSLI